MRAAALLLMLLVAGCVSPGASVEPAAEDAGAAQLAEGDALRWNGSRLTSGRVEPEDLAELYTCWAGVRCAAPLPPCDEARCERMPFDVPADAGAVVLSVRWPSGPVRLDVWIEDEAGAVLDRASNPYPGTAGLVARLDAPAPGRYVAVVAARLGEAQYEAALRVEPRAGPEGALLPDLVTLPPTDLTLETPDYGGLSYFVFELPAVREASVAAGAEGCRVDEVAERQAKRCLRFSNAVGNLGAGPLDIRLAPGATAFTQRVWAADGSYEERPGGAAEWHATHAHWHNAASNLFTVHAYDAQTRALGEALAEGKKGGVCFADTGLVDVGLPGTLRAHPSGGWGCLDPHQEGAWTMGLTPGWYDVYAYVLSDQYVDVTDLADGTYALCSVTNAEGTLVEADTTNNAACTPFRLEGSAVEPLEPEPYHAIPAEHRM